MPKKTQNDILSIISGSSNYRKNGRKINEIMINISGKWCVMLIVSSFIRQSKMFVFTSIENIISSLVSIQESLVFMEISRIGRFNCSIDGYVKLESKFSVENNKEFEAKKTQSINQIIPATRNFSSFFFPFIKWITRHSSALDVSWAYFSELLIRN